ncbi:Uncharacterized protein APZ42_026030 [Daphnia magna]|uniref:Uncharacterized protein n=1 Tax=Daphnia magna TaxID=35525 RepID=A0A164SKT0_9CRUS|nr:Uncharacterized protein APZ42_026030 [Daphnia magna]
MSDTDIHLTTLVNAAQNSELDLSPSKAYTKAEMVDNLALIATLQGSNMALATYAAPRQNQMTQRFQVIGGQQQNHAALQAIVAAPPNAPVIHPSTVADTVRWAINVYIINDGAEEEEVSICGKKWKVVDLVGVGIEIEEEKYEEKEELIIGDDLCDYLAEQSPPKRRGWMPLKWMDTKPFHLIHSYL